MSDLMNTMAGLLTALGALAALTSVITELTKNLGSLSRIPTDAQVIVTALILNCGAAWAWTEHTGAAPGWQLAAGAVVCGLLTAFIAMYGWATFFDLLQRFDPSRGGGERE